MGLTLTHTPGDWTASFALAVEFIAQDVLSDGEPFFARLTFDGDPIDVLVEVVAVRDTWLTIDTGVGESSVNIDELISFEVL